MKKSSQSQVHKLTKEDQNIFRRKLKNAEVEKDVENAYQELISKAIDANNTNYQWTSPYSTDGYFTEVQSTNLFNQTEAHAMFFKNFAVLRLLLETKYNESFTDGLVRCKTLLQAIYYLKKFEQNNKPLPNVVLIGDINECFVVAGSALEKYLKEKLDWSIPASKAGYDPKNNSIILQMVSDQGITPYVFTVSSKDVDLNTVIQLILNYAQGQKLIKLKITEKNIRSTYDWFINSVLRGNLKKYSPVTLVSIFIQSLCSPQTCYLVPNTQNKLHLNTGSVVPIDSNAYIAFFSRYEKSYSPKEIRKLTSIADRLIEETKRRFHGDFWTPTEWADKAQETLENVFGQNYREEFVVWDSSCGAKNLTRDYHFKELYLSTLHQSELDLSKEYNPQAITFQMDFLNDDVCIGPDTKDSELTKIPPHY